MLTVYEVYIPISFRWWLCLSYFRLYRNQFFNDWWTFRCFSAAQKLMGIFCLASAHVRNNASEGENLVLVLRMPVGRAVRWLDLTTREESQPTDIL